VGLVKQVDGLFGAKLESLLFMGIKDKSIGIGIIDKMQFLKQQLTAPQTAKRLQSYVDQFWGEGYALEIQTVKDKSAGFSAQALTAQKEQQQKDLLDQQIQAHPLVKTAQAIFKSQIKSIKELP
jgi:phage shock protein A